MFILYAGGIHFNLSTGVNVGIDKDIVKASASPDDLLNETPESEKIFTYPTMTFDLKLGYRWTMTNWFLDWNFLNLNLSPNFNLGSRSSYSFSFTTFRIGTIINKWSVYGLIDPICIHHSIFPDRDQNKQRNPRDPLSNIFTDNIGVAIAIGGGASYPLSRYFSFSAELIYKLKFLNSNQKTEQDVACLIGFELHSSKYNY